MWNYSFILPDFIILATFFAYYFAHPRLPVRLNHSFLNILIIDILTILTDVISSMSLEHPNVFSPVFLRCLAVSFFVFFVIRQYLFYVFTENLIINHGKYRIARKAGFFLFVFVELLVLANLFFDTVFVVSDEGLYSKGFFYNVIYISGLFYLVLSVSRILANRKKFSRSCFIGAVSFNIALFFGYVARIMFPNFLIMNLASLLAIIIIFFTYENPVFFLAGKANAYNKKALYAMFAELCESKSPLLIGFVIYNYNELREIYSGRQMDRGIALICEYIEKKYPDLLRFYLHDGRFVLLGRDNSKSSSLVKELTERFCSS